MLEKILESPLDCKEIQPVHPKGDQSSPSQWKDWCWSWDSNILSTWCKELTHWERPWCWKRLKAGGEGDNRGWDGWMASSTEWTWVWINSGSWWWPSGQEGLVYCSPWGRKEWDTTEWLNWTNWYKLQRSGKVITLKQIGIHQTQKKRTLQLEIPKQRQRMLNSV